VRKGLRCLLVHITPHCYGQPRHVMLWLSNSCTAQARKQRREYNKQEHEAENEAIILENRSSTGVDDPCGNKRVWRWWKCIAVADNFVDHLHCSQAGLTVEEKKEVLRQFWEDSCIRDLLP
jgi:hypothetical protein